MPLSDAQKAIIAAYKAQKADRARNARLTKAASTGPRQDEWAGHDKPKEVRSGAPNPEATGPKTEGKAPVGGHWQRGKDNAEHWIPDATWTPANVRETEREASVPHVISTAAPSPGSYVAVGRDGRMRNREACGPLPVEWKP